MSITTESSTTTENIIVIRNEDFRGARYIEEALFPTPFASVRAFDHVAEVQFINCNFQGIQKIQLEGLTGNAPATFTHCDFTNTSFWDLGSKDQPTRLIECDFTNSHLQGIGEDYNYHTSLIACNFTNTTLETLYFQEGDFADNQFIHTHLLECTWVEPDTFTRNTFSGVTMRNCAFDYVTPEQAHEIQPLMKTIALNGVSTINQIGYFQKNNRLYTATTLNHHELTINGDFEPTMDGDVQYSIWRTIEQDMLAPENADKLYSQPLPTPAADKPAQPAHKGMSR